MSSSGQKTYFDFVQPLRKGWAIRNRALDTETMWKTLGMFVLVGALLFLYLAQVSEEATTRAHIENLKEQHLFMTRQINNLMLEIAEMQAPQKVQEQARSLGMTRISTPDYLKIDSLPKRKQLP